MILLTFLATLWRVNRTVPVILAALLVLTVTLYGLQTFFLAPRLVAGERQLTDVQQQLRRGDLTDRNVLQAAMESDLQRFRERIPPETALSGLLGDLAALAEASSLTIDQISYKPAVRPEMQLLAYELNFSVTGTYAELKRFIHGLESSPRLIVIDQISLSSGKEDEGEERVSLALRLTTYFQRSGR